MTRGRPGRAAPDPAAVAARLRDAAAALGVPLDAETADRLLAFGQELLRWNRRVDLVGPADLASLAERHLLDSLSVRPWLARLGVRRLADLGSGAGLPGLVLALADPGLDVLSVEARARRAAFQRHAVRLLGLQRVCVVGARAGTPGAAAVAGVDAVVARAVTALPEYLALAAPLVRPGGVVLAMRGPEGEADARRAADAAARLDLTLLGSSRYELPGTVEGSGTRRGRTIVVFERGMG
jgi:16S rRNA (guanine527-N7)-methyltransferase